MTSKSLLGGEGVKGGRESTPLTSLARLGSSVTGMKPYSCMQYKVSLTAYLVSL